MVTSFYKGWLVAFLLSALLIFAAAPGISYAKPAASSLPLCQGADVIAELKRDNPPLYQQIKTLAASEVNDGAIFWRVTSTAGKVSYLYGTFHSTDPQVTSLDVAVEAAMNDAETIAVEVANLAPAEVQGFIKKRPELFFAIKTPKLDTLLSPPDFQTVRNLAVASGMTSSMVPLLKPWFANISLFAMPACEVARVSGGLEVLDNRIAARAKAPGKRLVGLETLSDQYSAFAKLDLKHQVTLLEDGIENHERLADYYMTSLRLYKERKLGYLLPLSLVMGRDRAKTKAALDEFKTHLIDNRNLRMFEAARPLVENGRAFIAVGALHLTGNTGLVAQFKAAGYKVEKML